MITDINNPGCDVKKLFDDFYQYLIGIVADKIAPRRLTIESFELNNVISWINYNNGNNWANIYEAQTLCDTWVICKLITKSTYLCTGLGLERFDIVCELVKDTT